MGINGFEEQQADQGLHVLGTQGPLLGQVEGLRVLLEDVLDVVLAQRQHFLRRVELRRRRTDLPQGGHEPFGVPVIGVSRLKIGGNQAVELRAEHVQDTLAETVAGQDAGALLVNHRALLVEHVVEVEQVLAHVEVMALDLHLRAGYGLGDELVFQGLVVVEAGPVHHVFDAVTAEPLHQFVLEGHKKLAAAGVALTTGAAPQLIVNSARLMVLGADDMQAAQVDNTLVLILPVVAVGVRATQHNVRAAPGHVGGHGDSPGAAGLGDDGRFLLVVAGVEYLVLHAATA